MQLNWTCLFIRAGWIKAFIFIIVGAQCHRSLSCWCGERRARTVHQWLQHILLITVSVIVITQGCFLTPSFSWLGLGRLQGCTTTGLSRKICKGLGCGGKPPLPRFIIYILAGVVYRTQLRACLRTAMENTLDSRKPAYPCSLPEDTAFQRNCGGCVCVCFCLCEDRRRTLLFLGSLSQNRASLWTTVTSVDWKHMWFNTLWLYGLGLCGILFPHICFGGVCLQFHKNN